jgi:hypothetical protein
VIKSRRVRLAGKVACVGEKRRVYKVLLGGKPRQLRRLRYRRENSIKMGLQEMGCEGMDWIDLAQDMDR